VYDSPQHTSIGGLCFYVDEVSIDARENDPDSDLGHVEASLRKSGYRNSPDMRYLRLVHLLDAQKRKELMIIYGDNGIAPGESNGVTKLLEKAKHRIWMHPHRSEGDPRSREAVASTRALIQSC
jgi:hypothetical protein